MLSCSKMSSAFWVVQAGCVQVTSCFREAEGLCMSSATLANPLKLELD